MGLWYWPIITEGYRSKWPITEFGNIVLKYKQCLLPFWLIAASTLSSKIENRTIAGSIRSNNGYV